MKKNLSSNRRGFSKFQPVAYEVERLIKPLVQSHGFCQSRILLDWPEIVGGFLAQKTQPEKIFFPRGQRTKGILTVRTISALAPEIQHLSPQIIERINQYFGYHAVERITLQHGSVEKRESVLREKPQDRPESPIPQNLIKELESVDDPALKNALERLYKQLF